MNFSDILNDYAPYKGIVENLNNTPVSVAGIVESAQGQLIYSLKNENKSSALVVCYSDMEARKLYSDISQTLFSNLSKSISKITIQKLILPTKRLKHGKFI